MSLTPSEKVIVTVEYPGGRIYRGKTCSATITASSNLIEGYSMAGIRTYAPGLTTWDMSFQGTGILEFTQDMAREMRSAIEWKCEWCGAVMPKAFRSCTQCGGQRSFLYDI